MKAHASRSIRIRCFIATLILLILYFPRIGGASVIPADIKKVVSFIYLENDKGEKIANGTGFYVTLKEGDYIFGYLVTAKHVLQDAGNFYSEIFIRQNTLDGMSEFIPMSLEYNQNVFAHPDPDVDLAAIAFFPKITTYEFKSLPAEDILPKGPFPKEELAEGDKTFFVGLFTSYIGEKKNYPIIRFGHVSLITDEKIYWHPKGWKKGRYVDFFLVESMAFGGNSGSPLFVEYEPTRDSQKIVLSSNSRLSFAGVVVGSFNKTNEVEFVRVGGVPVYSDNVGISAVIPSYKLYELIYSEQLENLRKNTVKELLEKSVK